MGNESLKLRGDVIIERRKKDGTVIDREELKNLIVNAGKERVAKLLTKGEASDAFGYIAIGLSETGDSVAVGDTALVSEVTRAEADDSGGSYEADYKCVFEKTFAFGTGEEYEIAEAGVFDSLTETGSTMFDRFVFSSKSVDEDTDLYVKVTVTVA